MSVCVYAHKVGGAPLPMLPGRVHLSFEKSCGGDATAVKVLLLGSINVIVWRRELFPGASSLGTEERQFGHTPSGGTDSSSIHLDKGSDTYLKLEHLFKLK